MGFAVFLSHCRDSLKSGGTEDSYTAAMKFCTVVFLVYLAIATDASKRKKVCKQIMGKLSDLEVLIKKKQGCCRVNTLFVPLQSRIKILRTISTHNLRNASLDKVL